MKRRIVVLLLTLVPAILLWVGCSPSHPAHDASNSQPAPVTKAGQAPTDHSQMDHTAMVQDTPDATGITPYPLTACLVSGETLGGMGKPVQVVYQGQEIKFCCKECIQEFQATPDTYLKTLALATTTPMAMPESDNPHAGHDHAH